MNCVKLDVTPTGTAGTATGTKTSPAPAVGEVYAISIKYGQGAVAGTEVKVTTVEDTGYPPALTLLDVTGNTNKQFYPTVPAHNTSGAAASPTMSVQQTINNQIKVEVLSADPNIKIEVWVFFGHAYHMTI